jgi:hypothetical protein
MCTYKLSYTHTHTYIYIYKPISVDLIYCDWLMTFPLYYSTRWLFPDMNVFVFVMWFQGVADSCLGDTPVCCYAKDGCVIAVPNQENLRFHWHQHRSIPYEICGAKRRRERFIAMYFSFALLVSFQQYYTLIRPLHWSSYTLYRVTIVSVNKGLKEFSLFVSNFVINRSVWPIFKRKFCTIETT